MKQWSGNSVRLATDALREQISGKRIALMMNTSALSNDGRLLMDVIVQDWKADVRFLFGMEHGVRGNLYAGDSHLADTDDVTGLPIANLYDYPGYCPPAEKIAEVDTVVFCAQDVGVRHWTYTPWMQRLMDAAAEVGREVIVLDRPNPIRGDIVEGAYTEPEYEGAELLNGYGYPLRHGMTIGEIALMYNAVRNVGCHLTVLPMEGYRRDMWYAETGLPWLPPSPNIPTAESPLYFAATGLLQSSNISLGWSTTTPFQYFGSPWMDGRKIADELNALDLHGVYCVPKFYQASIARQPVELCNGVMMVIQDKNAFRPVTFQLHIMDVLCRNYPEIFRLVTKPGIGIKRMGTEKVFQAAQNGQPIAAFIPEWERQAAAFAEERKPYLLYQ